MPPGQSKHVYNQERSYRRTAVPAPLSSFLRPPFVKSKNIQHEHFTAFLPPRRASSSQFTQHLPYRAAKPFAPRFLAVQPPATSFPLMTVG